MSLMLQPTTKLHRKLQNTNLSYNKFYRIMGRKREFLAEGVGIQLAATILRTRSISERPSSLRWT